MNINNGTDFVVSGVLKDIPQNSHLTFDVLIPFESGRNPDTSWAWNGFYTYLRLKSGSDHKAFESKVKDLVKRHNPTSTDEYYVQSLPDIHLKSALKWELSANGDLLNVKIMMTIGLFILVIATINYVNLVTAQAARRSKEVGIRKIVGANTLLLVRQFLIESVFMVMVSLAVSVILTSLCLPYTQTLFDYDLSCLAGQSRYVNIALPAVALTIGILAGLYPAFYLSSFEPIKVLKFRFLTPQGGIHVRQGLVVFQFVLSTGLIIGSLIIISQLRFMKQKNLGFDKENILLLPNVRGGIGSGNDPEGMIEEMKTVPGVKRIARADGILGHNNSTNGIATADNRAHIVLNFIRADYDFLPALKIKLMEGRNFSEQFASDSEAVILNKAAASQLGLKEPYVGQRLAWHDGAGKTREVNLIGVVENFHFGSLREPIKPFGFVLEVNNGSTFFLKLQTQDLDQTIAMVRKIWTKHYPERPFLYSFQDEQFIKLHLSETKFKKLFSSFTVLVLFIACLGMFGLVTYLAESKTKEIGIRKVLGSSVNAIVILLSKDFLKMVIIALAISSPLAYYCMQRWLQGFAYRIDIDGKVFVLTALGSVLIALVTVSFQSIKAARANPTTSLRAE